MTFRESSNYHQNQGISQSWQVRSGLNKRVKEIGSGGVVIYEKPGMPTNKKDSS
jgi:hypothetical protein